MNPFHGNNQLAHALIKAASAPPKGTNHILATKVMNVAISNHKQAIAFNAFKATLNTSANSTTENR